MSALAQLLLSQGARVTGTDRLCDRGVETLVIEKLRRLGIAIAPQDGSALGAGVSALVVSTAVEDDNPDMLAASANGVPIRHRADMLAECLSDMRCIAVAGTSGKSTITGMLGWIFEQTGYDPTVVNGAPVLNWQDENSIGNVRIGQSDVAIIEADESDRSLLRFDPEFSTISNISRDHFELEESIDLFAQFARRTAREVIVGPTVPRDRLGKNIYTAQGLPSAEGQTLVYRDTEFICPQPGRHNLENALVAVALCDRFGIELGPVRAALAGFAGIERRLQTVGRFQCARVIDDYAHNPAKIAAAWRTAAHGARRVIGIWRPHGFGPLHAMRCELVNTFKALCSSSDRLVIMPVYYAGGTTERRTTSRDLVDLLLEAGLPAHYLSDYDGLRHYLERNATAGDTILMMGARDPRLAQFAHELVL